MKAKEKERRNEVRKGITMTVELWCDMGRRVVGTRFYDRCRVVKTWLCGKHHREVRT